MISSDTKNRLMIMAILLIAFSVLAEVVVRWQLAKNPRLLYGKYPPNSLESFERGNFYYKPHHYYALELNPNYIKKDGSKPHNRHGLRGPEIPHKKDSEFRIACLGGSSTLSVLVRRHGATYPGQLEQHLNDGLNKPLFRVINGGIGTYTSAETLSAYIYKISELDPDLLILYQGVNDSHSAYYAKDHRDYRQHRRVWNLREGSYHQPANTFPPKWLSWLSRYSKVAHKISRYYYPYEAHIWGYSLRDYELTREQAWNKIDAKNFGDAFKKNTDSLIRLATSVGIKVVLVTVKMNGGDPVLQKGVHKLNQITRQLAKNHKLPLFDLARMPLPKGQGSLLNAMHFTHRGNQWRGKILANFLRQNQLVPQGSRVQAVYGRR